MRTINTHKHFSKSNNWFSNQFGTERVLRDLKDVI